MKMRMKVLAAAISAIGAAGSVQATVEAQAILNVTNVLFKTGATTLSNGTILDASQFVQLPNPGGLFITDTTNLNPCVLGVCNAYVNSVNGGSPLPLTIKTVGSPPGGDAFAPAPTPPLADGAKAASSLDGNPITGLLQPSAGGADAKASSLSQMVGTGTANTTASLTLSSVFTFTPTNDLKVDFQFDAFKYLLAYTDSPINATAGIGWNISIQDTTPGLPVNQREVFDWSPDGATGTNINGNAGVGAVEHADPCALTDSITAFFPASVVGNTCAQDGPANNGGLYSFWATTGVLKAGTTYNLSINHQTQAVVQNIPEPSSVLLAGLALAGVGFSARRKARPGN